MHASIIQVDFTLKVIKAKSKRKLFKKKNIIHNNPRKICANKQENKKKLR